MGVAIWAISPNLIVARAAADTSTDDSTASAATTTPPWALQTGSMIQISVASDGSVFGLNPDGRVYRLLNNSTWSGIGNVSGFTQVTHGTASFLFVLSKTGAVLQLNPATGAFTQVSAGPYVKISATVDGEVYALDKNHLIWKSPVPIAFHEFTGPAGGLTDLAGVSSDELWGVNAAGTVWHRKGAAWVSTTFTGGLAQIAAASDGSAWGINADGDLLQYNGKSWPMVSRPSGTLKQISVGYEGDVWGVNSKNAIYTYTGNQLLPPPAAAAVGITTNAFNSDFRALTVETNATSAAKTLIASKMVDIDDSETAGFGWYMRSWNSKVANPSDFTIQNDRGVHALRMDGSARDPIIYTVLAGKNGVVGKQWGGAVPAYYEARVAFSLPSNAAVSWWPAFWSLPNLDKRGVAWPDDTLAANENNGLGVQPYTTDMEVDFMEYMPLRVLYSATQLKSGTNVPPLIASTMHNWYGIQGGTCKDKGEFQFCQIASGSRLPSTSLRSYDSPVTLPTFNTIGALVMPAAANGGKGYLQYYLDNVPYGTKVEWTGTPPKAGDPASLMPNLDVSQINSFAADGTPQGWKGKSSATLVDFPKWVMGAMDLQPHGLILQSGGGAYMDVQWVRAWQK